MGTKKPVKGRFFTSLFSLLFFLALIKIKKIHPQKNNKCVERRYILYRILIAVPVQEITRWNR
jgi:hypothetical protein